MLSEKPWRGEAVLQFCGALLFCWCLGLTVASLLHGAGVAGFRQPESFGVLVVGTLSFQGAAWVLIWFFLRQHQMDWRGAFGFRGPRLKNALLWSVGILVPVLLVALFLEQVSAWGLERLGWPPEDQRAVELLAHAKSWWVRGYLAGFAVVLAPVAEEFIFRGMLFPYVQRLGWPKLAWFGVSFLFALIHMNAPTFVSLFMLAMVLTWLYEKTGNLLAPIAAHSLFNTANLVILHFQEPLERWLQLHPA